ncbi:MAG: PQQ-binding-like beta-propeller repeat protein [Alphaproteobacteria bacterium]|nr:PQQ-binding-like beta-propeller repeat protein [Alphaproteobacteria bacterium]
MLYKFSKCLFFGTIVIMLSACTMFQEEKILPEGKRISALGTKTELKQNIKTQNTKIRLPLPKKNSKWSQNGGNALHNMLHLKSSPRLEEYWSANFGEGASKRDFLIASPIIAHRVVFAIDADAVVSARRLDNGKKIWHKRLKPINKDDKGIALKGAGIAYGNQRIYATTGFGGVFALDMKTGKEIWRYDTEMPIRIAPTVQNGRLLVQTIDNALIALNAINGEEVWKYKTTSEMTTLVGGASPAYSSNEDVAVAAFSNGELRAFKASTGTPLWGEMLISPKRTNSLANITAIKANPIIDGDKVFAAGHSDVLAAIDLRTGKKIWEREISTSNQPWIAGQFMYVLTDNFELIAFQKDTGLIIWNKKLPIPDYNAGLSASGPVLTNNSLLVTLSDGHVFAISPYTGQVLGFINVDDEVELSPIVADGVVIFTTNEADLLAYK